jgi:hypothetical protein
VAQVSGTRPQEHRGQGDRRDPGREQSRDGDDHGCGDGQGDWKQKNQRDDGGWTQAHRDGGSPAIRVPLPWEVREKRAEFSVGPRGERRLEAMLELLGVEPAFDRGITQSFSHVFPVCV